QTIAPEAMQPQEDPIARKSRPAVEIALAAADQSDGADAGKGSEREGARQFHRPRVLALGLRRDAHRRGRVDDEVDRHALRRLVFLEVNLTRAGGHSPVYRLDRIARLIEPRLDVFDAGAEKRRGVGAEAQAVGQALDLQRELPLVEMIADLQFGFYRRWFQPNQPPPGPRGAPPLRSPLRPGPRKSAASGATGRPRPARIDLRARRNRARG